MFALSFDIQEYGTEKNLIYPDRMSCVLRTIAFSQILAILKIMGGKDIAQKNLEDWNDVFADIVNVLLFNGENVVKEEDLE